MRKQMEWALRQRWLKVVTRLANAAAKRGSVRDIRALGLIYETDQPLDGRINDYGEQA